MPVRTLCILASLLLLAPAAHAEEQRFELSPFQTLDVSRGLTVDVAPGPQSVVATSDDAEHLDDLSLEVRDGTLYVTLNESFFQFLIEGGLVGALLSDDAPIRIAVTMPTLTGAATSTGAAVSVGAVPTAGAFSGSASTGSRLQVEAMDADIVSLSASTGARVQGAGACGTGAFQASTGARIEGDGLACERAEATASSGAFIALNVAQSATLRASSGGTIEAAGDPRAVDREESSGGHVAIR